MDALPVTVFERLPLDGLHLARCLRVCRAWRHNIMRSHGQMERVNNHVVAWEDVSAIYRWWPRTADRQSSEAQAETALERLLLEQHYMQRMRVDAYQDPTDHVADLIASMLVAPYEKASYSTLPAHVIHRSGDIAIAVLLIDCTVAIDDMVTRVRKLCDTVFPDTLLFRTLINSTNSRIFAFGFCFKRWTRDALKQKWRGQSEILRGMSAGEMRRLQRKRVEVDDPSSESEWAAIDLLKERKRVKQ